MKYSTELMPSRFNRARSIRHALDDIYGGDYGAPCAAKCEMPVVAVAAAVWGGAALAAGAVGFAAIAAVGAIVSGVGVLVGSPELSKIGGIMGLAGGVGMLGTSQGWTGFADMDKAMGGMGGAAEAATNTGAMANAQTAGVTPSSPADPAGFGATAQSAEATGGGLIQSATAEPSVLQNTLAGPTNALSGGAVAGQPIATVDQLAAQATGQTGSSVASPGLLNYASGQTPASASSMWDKFESLSGWMDQHKVASEAILKGISGFSDSFSDKTAAGIAKDQAMADLYGTRAATEQAQLANSNYAPNVANRFALTPGLTPFQTGTPTYIAPRTGLLNAR